MVVWCVRRNGANKPVICLILSQTGIEGIERIRSHLSDAPGALVGSPVFWN